jgi:tRNA-2-methylthio-N6-dimethylallyladenosine synthase
MKINNKTYNIITIGCQMNISDSERLAAWLKKSGFKNEPDFKKAEVVIFNTCGIRQTAEDRVYGLVNQVNKFNPKAKIVIAGCLSKRQDVKKRLIGRADLFLPINELIKLPDLLAGDEYKASLSLDEVRLKDGEKYLAIKPDYNSKFSASVPIGNGCNNFCSYCVVPYARGREVYRSAADIIKEVNDLVEHGYKEIILLAQNVNSYHDEKYDFPKLLKQLVKIKGKFWIRFSSSHPKDLSDELIKVMSSSNKICYHLHVAVQSGDDKILERMNRKYTVKHFESLIKKMRKAKPGIAVTTDVIVGFPGETKAQFLNTVKLFEKLKFTMAYISKYSPRPGTVSAKMKDNVSPEEKKRREQVLTLLLRQTALEDSQKYLNKNIEVLIEGINKRGKYYGKTSTYKTVLVNTKKNNKLLGNFVLVKIKSVNDFGLEGKLAN